MCICQLEEEAGFLLFGLVVGFSFCLQFVQILLYFS